MPKLSARKWAIAHGPNPEPEPDAPTTFTEVLKRIAPDRGKVIFLESDGGEIIKIYATLRERATRMLGGLRDFGLQPGNPIILQVDRPDFIPAFWSCILGGFLPVPISIAPNYERPNKVITKLHDVWNLLNHPPILTTAVLAPQIRGAFEQHGTEVQTPTLEIIETYPPDTQWYPSQPDDLAFFLLSSGTTGKPKLITRTHQCVVNVFFPPKQNKSLSDAETIYLIWTPFDHIVGLYIIAPNVGCKIHLSTAAFLQNPLLWLDIIQKYRVTHALMMNFALKLVLDCLDTVSQRRWNLSSLRQIILGAEPIVAKTARTFLKRLAVHGLSADVLCPDYGMSEIGSITLSKDFSLGTTSDDDPFVVVGQPTPRNSIRIVDRFGDLLQEGQIGSIEVTGSTMTVGYYQNSKANRTAFTADGWFRTGDLGFLQNGCLTVTGREKEIIIINGVNYHSHQIDKVVEEIEGVTPSYTVACGVRQPSSNTDELAIFFHTSVEEPNRLSVLLREIRRVVVRRVGVNPTYLIPVAKSVIPKTGTGKIQRLELKQRFEAGEFDAIYQRVEALPGREFVAPNGKVDRRALPVPNQTRLEPEETFVSPRDELELQLTKIWEKVLGIQPIGVRDNFFDLGGHSLLAVRLFAQIEKAFKKNLPLSVLFQAPTIEQLASFSRLEGWSQSWSSLVAIQPSGSKPPFFCVHEADGHVFCYRELANYLGLEQPFYGLQPQHVDGKRGFHSWIEDVAAHYIKEIRTLQPEGPYFLGGLCAGGIIAFEMAQQLQVQGQKVALLALFDAAITSPPKPPKPAILVQARRHLNQLSQLSYREKLTYILQRAKGRIAGRLLTIKAISELITYKIYLNNKRFLPQVLSKIPVREAFIFSRQYYVPQAYQGRVTLFRVSEGSANFFPTESLFGWDELAAGGVEVYDVPGMHGIDKHGHLNTFLQDPYVQILADKLKLCIDKAQTNYK